MNALLQRVKTSLNNQHYLMNDSWLSDCVDFYMNDHENPTQDEIAAFVMNQWVLYDIRETNNENGCLPKNLASQKITTLSGKYILQVNKMYDISTSKFKQLEKIRNVSSENVDATEIENKTQDDKFQTWEPKSKRMFQLFLTDGVQDILGIEYKTIRFLKKELLPGYKLMIKGPVICRKGVLLLEENNIIEIGGEADSLLILNAIENVLARALNLDENPDPYNDKNRPKQNTESTQKTAQVDDDFDIDSQAIDEIDKQIQQQNTNTSKKSATSNLSNKQSLSSKISEFNYSYQAPSISSKTQKSSTSSARNPLLNSGNTLDNQRNHDNEKMVVDFDDGGDSFLEMVDDSAFKTPSVSKTSTVKSKVASTKEALASISKGDEFPVDDEIYDLQDFDSTMFSSSKPKSQSTATKTTSLKKDSSSIIASSSKTIYNEKNTEKEAGNSKTNLKENSSIASSYRSTSKVLSKNKETFVATPSVSDIDNFDDLDFNDIDMDFYENEFDKNTKNNLKSNEAYTSSSPKVKSKNAFLGHSTLQFNTNSTATSDTASYENEFEQDFFETCKNKLLTEQKSSQVSAKSLSTLKSKEPVSASTFSQVYKNSSAKLSDKLKFDNENKDYFNTNKKVEENNYRSSQMSSSNLFKSKNADTATEHSAFQTNKSSSDKTKSESKHLFENLDPDFENDFDIEFEARMEVDNKPVVQQKDKNTLKFGTEKNTRRSPTKSQDLNDNNSDVKSTSSKRQASPSTSGRQKLRCVEGMPKDKTSSRKITDFFDKPKPKLLNSLPFYEAICDVLENSREKDKIRTVVRGKVINVVKLNLLKGENGSYFHLDGTITDGTASLDVVFSSEVLEEIVGYSTQDFILKRKRAKAVPSVKDELRDDLKKAQQILRLMDALMEIEVKKDEKTLIVGIRPLTKEDKKQSDERLQRYKAEKKLQVPNY